MALLTRELTWFQVSLLVCNNNRKIMEEYGIIEHLELTVTRCGRWTGNREFIWSGLKYQLDFLNSLFPQGKTASAIIGEAIFFSSALTLQHTITFENSYNNPRAGQNQTTVK